MERISTERLELVLLPEEFLAATVAGAMPVLESVVIPEDWRAWTDFAAIRLDDIRRDGRYRIWSLRAIVYDGAMVGFCGFHTVPDAEAGVEFGYTVFPAFRGRGFAAEAAGGLMKWASREYGVQRFVLSIGRDNHPSKAVARKLGFQRIGSQMDPLDGLEDVYATRLDGAGWTL